MKYLVTDQNLGEFFFVVIWQLVASFLDKFLFIFIYIYIYIHLYLDFYIQDKQYGNKHSYVGAGWWVLFYNKLHIQIDRGNLSLFVGLGNLNL